MPISAVRAIMGRCFIPTYTIVMMFIIRGNGLGRKRTKGWRDIIGRCLTREEGLGSEDSGLEGG